MFHISLYVYLQRLRCVRLDSDGADTLFLQDREEVLDLRIKPSVLTPAQKSQRRDKTKPFFYPPFGTFSLCVVAFITCITALVCDSVIIAGTPLKCRSSSRATVLSRTDGCNQ